MKTGYGGGSYGASSNSNPVRIGHLGGPEGVCWFVAIGLSLTALFCALGYAETIGQALAMSG